MARSFSSAKAVTALVANAISRRGYSAASEGIVSSVARGGVAAASRSVSKKPASDVKVGSTEKVAWGPDPVTGYYRPETGVEEIDPAELRAMLLKKN